MMRLWHLAVFAAVPCMLLVAWWSLHTPANTGGTTYGFDTVSGKLFTTHEGVPPFEAPSGPDAGVLVHAVIFSGESRPTPICLITYTPESRELMRRGDGNAEQVAAGMLVRRPTDVDWTPANTPAGRAIREGAADVAAGRTWVVALPP